MNAFDIPQQTENKKGNASHTSQKKSGTYAKIEYIMSSTHAIKHSPKCTQNSTHILKSKNLQALPETLSQNLNHSSRYCQEMTLILRFEESAQQVELKTNKIKKQKMLLLE